MAGTWRSFQHRQSGAAGVLPQDQLGDTFDQLRGASSGSGFARARGDGSNPRCAFSSCAAEVWIDLHLPRLQQPFRDVAVILVLCAPGPQLNRTDTGLVREAQFL
jgi:hypothetical protein